MKDKRKPPFPVRTSDEVKSWLQEKAKRNDRSVNYVINRILENAKQREEENLL